MPDDSQPLTSLQAGVAASISAINLPPADKPRLMEMGLLVGTPIELIRFAPLGDPERLRVREPTLDRPGRSGGRPTPTSGASTVSSSQST